MTIQMLPTKMVVTVVALLTITSIAPAQKNWDAPKIVTSYCSGCHDIDGNSQLPYIPKLGGLNATYAAKKITAFKEPDSPPVEELYWWTLKVIGAKKKDSGNLTRNERINMEGVAHAAKPEILEEAALWYSKQPPMAGHSSDAALMEKGNDLFTKGVPAQKIIACATCHGPNAEGSGLAPRLAGQNAEYVVNQLAKFTKGDRKHSPEMTMVTKDLNPEQARAVAAYLQSR